MEDFFNKSKNLIYEYPPNHCPSIRPQRKKVCVIGAGLSGIIATKELLQECHHVKCYEASDGVGGVFNHCYESLLLTVSSDAMVFSTFEQKDYQKGRFFTAKEYVRYLKDFCIYYELFDYITFNTKIIKIEEFDEDQFLVITISNGVKKKEVFDSVVVCSGAFQKKKIPDVIKDNFKGELIHSSEYEDSFDRFHKKNVLIVGMGESGADIAHEVSNIAGKSMLAVRGSSQFTIPRFFHRRQSPRTYIPADHESSPLVINLVSDHTLWNDVQIAEFFNSKVCKLKGDKVDDPLMAWNKRNLDITKRIWAKAFTKNEIFLRNIQRNKLAVNYSGIKNISDKTVFFEDGKSFTADIIVCCTGFSPYFSFFDDKNRDFDSLRSPNFRDFFRHAIPPDFMGRIAFIGFARPLEGGVPIISELQARYFALLCSSRRILPDNINALIKREKEREEKLHYACKESILTNFKMYVDGIAYLIGCDANPRDYLFTDPYLAFKLYTTPLLFSVRYRIKGPGNMAEKAKAAVKKQAQYFKFRHFLSFYIRISIWKYFSKTSYWFSKWKAISIKNILLLLVQDRPV